MNSAGLDRFEVVGRAVGRGHGQLFGVQQPDLLCGDHHCLAEWRSNDLRACDIAANKPKTHCRLNNVLISLTLPTCNVHPANRHIPPCKA